MNDHILEKLYADLKEKAKEVEKIYSVLKALHEYDTTIEIPDINALIASNGDAAPIAPEITIKPDEFYNMTNTEATEKYLRKVGEAASLDDIYDALTKGGLSFVGNGRSNLNLQLTRATRKFAKITSDSKIHFGLLEWYPKRKKATGSNGSHDEVTLDETETKTVDENAEEASISEEKEETIESEKN